MSNWVIDVVYDDLTIGSRSDRHELISIGSATVINGSQTVGKVQEAQDVDMALAADGSLPAWNQTRQMFEVQNTLRGQILDGGNF
ncbi:MAG: hypothetical protein LPL29_02240 [Alphaproteobacteria bacterium]|nr:hypothetical protein [Alphaproteobacteria bacterium]